MSFFKLIYAMFGSLLTDLTLFISFWISQWAESRWHVSGRTARLPTFRRWINWESKHWKWRSSPEFCCMPVALHLWLSADYSQQTNEDKHLHSSSSGMGMPQCHPVPLFVQFATSPSLGWRSIPTSRSLIPLWLSQGISLVGFLAFLPCTLWDCLFLLLFFCCLFAYSVGHPPGLFSHCCKIVLQSGGKRKPPECWRGLCTTSKAEWKQMMKQHWEWSGQRQREGNCHSGVSSAGVCVFCVAGKVRNVPCDIKHCSLLLLPTHHLLLKPKHFFFMPRVPCPVNADERC